MYFCLRFAMKVLHSTRVFCVLLLKKKEKKQVYSIIGLIYSIYYSPNVAVYYLPFVKRGAYLRRSYGSAIGPPAPARAHSAILAGLILTPPRRPTPHGVFHRKFHIQRLPFLEGT